MFAGSNFKFAESGLKFAGWSFKIAGSGVKFAGRVLSSHVEF